MGAHTAGDVETTGVVIAGNHQGGARGTGYTNSKTADGAASNHQHRAAGDLPLENGMNCVAERVHNGADLGGNSVQLHDVRCRHHDVLGKRPVSIDPDDLSPLAEV